MTGRVMTVLGEVDAADLGRVDSHDHLLIVGGFTLVREPAFRLDSLEAAIEETQEFKVSGGGAIVDTMAMGAGRDAEGLAEISRRTGVHVIATTGFVREGFYAPDHWIHSYSEDELADLVVAEFEQGMERSGYAGPLIRRSEARPGAIKLATDLHHMKRTTSKLFGAGAQAHRRTGLPILTHTDYGTMALDQVEQLYAGGVEPGHIVLSHMDRDPDPVYVADVADTGAFVCFDYAARTERRSDYAWVPLIKELERRGLQSRLLFGLDFARRDRWRCYGGGPGLRYLFGWLTAHLERCGIDPATISAASVDNPARAFSLSSAVDA